MDGYVHKPTVTSARSYGRVPCQVLLFGPLEKYLSLLLTLTLAQISISIISLLAGTPPFIEGRSKIHPRNSWRTPPLSLLIIVSLPNSFPLRSKCISLHQPQVTRKKGKKGKSLDGKKPNKEKTPLGMRDQKESHKKKKLNLGHNRLSQQRFQRTKGTKFFSEKKWERKQPCGFFQMSSCFHFTGTTLWVST